ncbi:MAG: divergent PAP2 family protein [Anaerolineales bacterium]|nr:divergent PAP2 family protein [Anaerolineales bacterium]
MKLIIREFIRLNVVLVTALTTWTIAQALKVLVDFVGDRKWNWVLLFEAGGMPSSHSAMVSSTAYSIGLFLGFDSALFALATILAMVVIYDATGIRYQAGKQAELLNKIMTDISKGKFDQQKRLTEVLGHTPGEAILGTILGLVMAQLFWFVVR